MIGDYLDERERIAAGAWPRPWRGTGSPDWGLYDNDDDSVAHGSATGDLEVSEENLAAIVDAVNEAPRLTSAVRSVLRVCDQLDEESARAIRSAVDYALAKPYRGEGLVEN